MTVNWPKWRTWREADWGVLVRCLWLIPVAELAVRWLSPRHWLPQAPAAGEEAAAAAGAAAAEVARWVDAAYRRSPFPSSCLTRSLVLYRVLRARRLPSRLRIGVSKPNGAFEAHAWVECAGAALNDRDALHHDFAPLDNILTERPLESE
jgi:hypothetical protein